MLKFHIFANLAAVAPASASRLLSVGVLITAAAAVVAVLAKALVFVALSSPFLHRDRDCRIVIDTILVVAIVSVTRSSQSSPRSHHGCSRRRRCCRYCPGHHHLCCCRLTIAAQVVTASSSLLLLSLVVHLPEAEVPLDWIAQRAALEARAVPIDDDHDVFQVTREICVPVDIKINAAQWSQYGPLEMNN